MHLYQQYTYINNKQPFPGLGSTMDPQAYNSPISVTSSPHPFIHIKHSQANLQLGLSDCPAKPIHNWVYQDAGNQANTVITVYPFLSSVQH